MAISILRVHNAVFSGATPAAQNFDLSSADAVLILATAWVANTLTLDTCTVAGVSTTITGLARSGDENAVYGAFLANCSTSATAAIQPAWSNAPGEGPTIHIVVLSCAGGQDISVIDSDFDAATGFGIASVTSTSANGDFVVGQAEAFGVDPTLGAGQNAFAGSTYTNNSEHATVYSRTATTTTVTSISDTAGDAYPSVSQFVLREVAGAATTSLPEDSHGTRNLRRNPVYRMTPGGIYAPVRAYGFLHAA